MKLNIHKLTGLALTGMLALTIAGTTLATQAKAAPGDSIRLAEGAPTAPTEKKGLQKAGESMSTFSANAGISTQGDLTTIIGKIVRGFLGLLGTIFVVLTIYAGFLWMTAAGNEEQITKAKKLITNAVIGMIIVLLAYVITGFVIGALSTATLPDNPNTPT